MSDSAADYTRRGGALHRQGRLAEAVELLRQAVAVHPHDGFLYAQLGSSLWEADEREASIGAWRESTRLDADLESPRLILSFHLREVGRPEEAIAVLRAGLEACPRSRATWLGQMTEIHQRLGEIAEARRLYEEALTLDPDNVCARRGRDEILHRLRRQRRARKRARPRITRWF
jgi:tetratricopeptide (TPR) repeat protein